MFGITRTDHCARRLAAGDAIDHLLTADNLPEQFYHVTLVDVKVDHVSLGRLMVTRRNVALKDIAEETTQAILVTKDEADAAYVFNQYLPISTPVLYEDGRIVGVITIDDAMLVWDEENEEDILRLAGVGQGKLSDTVLQTILQRFPWLAVFCDGNSGVSGHRPIRSQD